MLQFKQHLLRRFLTQMTSCDVHYDVIYRPFPISSQYLKTWGVDSPACIACIVCIELLLLPTSIQSGGWILHFLLCFRNIATHRGTSVGSDALNGPMSPWIEKQQYDPWRVYTLKRHLLYIRVISLHSNHKTDKQSLPRSNKFCSQRSSSGSIFFPFLQRIQLLKDPLGSRGNKEHLSEEWKYKYNLK